MPHEDVDSEAHGWQAPPAVQHPLGHDVASHTQLPAVLQSCPAAHALHVVPPAPHDADDSPEIDSHVLEVLQQPAQAAPPHEQAPPEHDSPVAHEPHVAPPLPHSDPDCPDCSTHCPPALQQPFGHEAALHTHCPVVSQVWPAPHAAHIAPPVPHTEADCTLNRSHCPFALQQPCGQLAGPHDGASPGGASFALEPSWAASLPGAVESSPPSEDIIPSPPPSPVLPSG